MAKIPTQQFIDELLAIDPRVTVINNPNFPELKNVKFLGQDISPIPANEITEEPDQDYRFTFPNGMSGRHKSRIEVLDALSKTIHYVDASPENLKDFTDEA